MVQKRNHFLPYSLPLIGKEEIQEVTETLESGWLSKGPKVQQFEKEFAAFVGAKHAVAVNSCTAALFLALKAKGIGPGTRSLPLRLRSARLPIRLFIRERRLCLRILTKTRSILTR